LIGLNVTQLDLADPEDLKLTVKRTLMVVDPLALICISISNSYDLFDV